MYRLQSVGIMSVGRTMAAIQGGISLLFVPILLIFAFIGVIAAPGAQKLPALLFLVLAFVLPVAYAAMGFVIGALMGVFYNLVAGKFGGIEMQFVPAPLVPGTGLPQSYTPPGTFPTPPATAG